MTITWVDMTLIILVSMFIALAGYSFGYYYGTKDALNIFLGKRK